MILHKLKSNTDVFLSGGISSMAKRITLQHLGLCLILLHLTCGVFDAAEVVFISKSLGENIKLHCNTSGTYATKIRWTKDGIDVYIYSPVFGTQQNFTSNRMSIDPAHLILHISDMHECDEGTYTCGVKNSVAVLEFTKTWNLTVTSDRPKGYIWVTIIPGAVILIIILIMCAILCIYRTMKRRNNSGGLSNESREGRDFEMSQQRQDQRINRHSSQYFERYNSVYGKF